MSVSVCLSVCVCVCDHVFRTARPIFAEFFVRLSVCPRSRSRVGAIQAKRQARRTGSDRREYWTAGM